MLRTSLKIDSTGALKLSQRWIHLARRYLGFSHFRIAILFFNKGHYLKKNCRTYVSSHVVRGRIGEATLKFKRSKRNSEFAVFFKANKQQISTTFSCTYCTLVQAIYSYLIPTCKYEKFVGHEILLQSIHSLELAVVK